jgi:hypothetical protein
MVLITSAVMNLAAAVLALAVLKPLRSRMNAASARP